MKRTAHGQDSPDDDLLTPEQRRALRRVRAALEIIKRESKQAESQEQARAMSAAYHQLTWQCSPLCVGIHPLRESTPQEILDLATFFERRVDQRYPNWRTLIAGKQSAQASGAMASPDGAEPPGTFPLEAAAASGSTGLPPEGDAKRRPPKKPATGEDCRCTNHSGPHWLSMNYWWYEQNLTHLERCLRHVERFYALYLTREQDPMAAHKALQEREGAVLADLAFWKEEGPRVRETLFEMESRQMKCLSYNVLGPGFVDLHERERELRRAINAIIEQLPS